MRQRILVGAVCPHCGKSEIHYYMEAGNGCDLYYCPECFGCAVWNGEKVKRAKGKAYPDRSMEREKFGESDEGHPYFDDR